MNDTDPSPTDRQTMLQALSQEHQHGLAFAEEIARIARSGDAGDVARGVNSVREYNRTELEAHLQHEEQTIFGPLVRRHRQYVDMCVQLGKEHGLLRSLVERLDSDDPRTLLAEFAKLLENHTLLEEQWLFPVIASTLTDDELRAVADFTPLAVLDPAPAVAPRQRRLLADGDWLAVAAAHHAASGATGASIVLFPRYQPELAMSLAEHLGLDFFDLREDYLQQFGVAADRRSLAALNDELKARTARSGLVCHNVEALLGVKSPQERAAWFEELLAAPWPNPVVVPVTVFQGDVPEQHPRVCDLELFRLPYLPVRRSRSRPLRYDIERPA
jgi:hemerythrin-like domain-containing protein